MSETCHKPRQRPCMTFHQRRRGTLISPVPSGDQRAIDLGVIVGSGHDWHLGLVGRRVPAGNVKDAVGIAFVVQSSSIPSLMPTHIRPRLIAHRGMPQRHRENTLEGFLAASVAGADAWELDVHATRDGVVVVHHDATLPVSAGVWGERAIASADWSALREAPVGSAGERMPTLDAVLEAAAASATEVCIEIKARNIEMQVLACLARHPDVPVAIHSFDHRVGVHVHTLSPATRTGILLASYLVDPAHALRGAMARDYWPHRAHVDRALVDAIHDAGGRVVVWTVNDPDEAMSLAALGVDAICTDVVDELRAVLKR